MRGITQLTAWRKFPCLIESLPWEGRAGSPVTPRRLVFSGQSSGKRELQEERTAEVCGSFHSKI